MEAESPRSQREGSSGKKTIAAGKQICVKEKTKPNPKVTRALGRTEEKGWDNGCGRKTVAHLRQRGEKED